MIETYQKARFHGFADHIVDAAHRIMAFVGILLCLFSDILLGVFEPCVSMKNRTMFGILLFGIQIDMIAFIEHKTAVPTIVDGDFCRIDGQEICVRQVILRYEYFMICIRNDGIALLHIQFFNLLRGKSSVRHIGMRVHIGFIKLTVLG